MTERARILVSACLLGEKVRYDGGHKRDLHLMETLGPFVEWVRVCPEVDGGLPVPREAMRLEDRSGIALDVLSLAAAPLCKQAPPTVEAAGSGDEPLPPEDGTGSSSGPVTSPQ